MGSIQLAAHPSRVRAPEKSPARRLPELDGIRGIAILLVLIFHFWQRNPICQIGWVGVDLFFVLSGFLITGILLDSRASERRWSNFYLRRVLRIFPLYYLYVIGCFVLLPAVGGGSPPQVMAIWYWLPVSNWHSAFYPTIYLPVSHLWSLAIEEQFYFVWPFLVLWLPAKRLIGICCAGIASCLLLRNLDFVQAAAAEHHDFIYRSTLLRMDSLIFGGLSALCYKDSRLKAVVLKWTPLMITIAGVALAAILWCAGDSLPDKQPMSRFGFTVLGVLFAFVVLRYAHLSGTEDAISRILRTPILQGFGKYSYAIYVLHVPLVLFRSRLVSFGPAADFMIGVLFVALSYFAGFCSWHLIEKHFLKLQSRFR